MIMWLDNTYIGWTYMLVIELLAIGIIVIYSIKDKYMSIARVKKNWRKYTIISVLIIPIAIYILHFSRNDWSYEPADWGSFGDFIGGVYSVILTILLVYVTYTIERKSEEVKECRNAIKEIYRMVLEIDSQNINIDYIHKIIRCIEANSLHLSNTIYDNLIREMDYYICVAGDKNKIDLKKEQKIKDMLKFYYNEH